MNRRRVAVAIGVLAVVTLALGVLLASGFGRPSPADSATVDIAPRIAPRPIGGDAAWIARIPAVRRTHALVDLPVHVAPGGPDLALPGGPTMIERDQDLVVLGDPTVISGVDWLRVYVLQLTSGMGPDDIFAWIPATVDGHPTVSELVTPTCPATTGDLVGLAALDPFSRVRCQGADSFTISGRTWNGILPVWYDTSPGWLGGPNGPGPLPFSIHNGTIQHELDAGAIARFVDLHVPPGLTTPPADITLEATVHLADSVGATCQRTDRTGMTPAEAAADSELWCATQLVVEQWTPLLGSEDKPFDVRAPQLHRFAPFDVCGGVGMSTLTFHVDRTSLDPVWLETQGSAAHVIAWFGPEYRVEFRPDLVVVDATGQVVVRDGTTFDPESTLAGRPICPTTDGVYIN